MKDAFVHALGGSLTVSCAVAFAGAALALGLIESKKQVAPHELEATVATAEQVAA
jgi:hypothetical protein